MHETALFRPKSTGKFPEFILTVRRDLSNEIDRKRKICSKIRFFDMITQNLNLNVRFLIVLFFWTFEIFAIMHETTLSRPNDTGKFSEFFLRVRRDNNDEIDYKRKICSTVRFFDMISQSLNLSLFATYKLIRRPLPSKRHGEIS